ncbi:MAG: Gp37 family protein [Flavobacteriales bacterium]|jgi:hypothetical protein
MNYEQIENDVVARLAPLADAGIVIKLPEFQKEFEKQIDRYKITVAYKGSKFEDVHTTAHVAQFEDVMIDVTIESRKLRGPGGVYPLMAAVRNLLLGFEPTDCSRMTLKESSFTDLETNTWSYSFTFVTRGMVVEVDPEENDPELRTIEVQNENGEPVISITP